jgi:energy-coupling factor transporter ATP-binding protein EcfA2
VTSTAILNDVGDAAALTDGSGEGENYPRRGIAVLETKHLSRSVGQLMLVQDVNIQVSPGEILAVVDPSGAGKSSLLRLLNRLDEPTAGTRSLRADISMLVPVGSMIIANAMNACAQAAERFRAEIVAHVGQIEAGLSLGAEPAVTVAPYLQSAVYASLLPRLDMLKSLGLVWIPGVMAGMMVSGASPVYAAVYQFVVVAMILAASGIAGLVVTVCMRSRVFSSAAQLAFRPTGASTPTRDARSER